MSRLKFSGSSPPARRIVGEAAASELMTSMKITQRCGEQAGLYCDQRMMQIPDSDVGY